MKTLAAICMFLCFYWTAGEPFADDQFHMKNSYKASREMLNQMALLQETSDHPVPPVPEGKTTAELLSQSASEETSIQSAIFGIRSTGWTPQITICFHNKRGDSINVFWIDYQGSFVCYNTLGPYQGYCQLTYGTHPWFIYTTTGTFLEIVIPLQANMDITIENEAAWCSSE